MGTQPSVAVIRWALRAVFVLVLASMGVSVFFIAKANAWGDIPAQAYRYKDMLRRSALTEDGPNAPVALYAAQLAQESGWNPEAASPVGARGLAQSTHSAMGESSSSWKGT